MKWRVLGASLLTAFLSVGVAYSAYVIVNDRKSTEVVLSADSTLPVAQNASTKVYYSTVEKALETASSGQQINVIPLRHPTITRDCEVKSGVTLNITPSIGETVYGNPTLTFSGWSNNSGTVTFKLQKNNSDYLTWTGTYTISSSPVNESGTQTATCSRSLHSGSYSSTFSYSYYRATLKFTYQTADGATSAISKSFTTSVTGTGTASGNCSKWVSCTASKNSWEKTLSYTYTYTPKVTIQISSVQVNGVDEYIGLNCAFESSITSTSTHVPLSGSDMGTWSSSASLTIPDYSDVSKYGTSQLTSKALSGGSSSTVKVKEGVTLTNNGTIYIGGTLAAGAGTISSLTYAGHTYGTYAQLVLGEDASLVNNGAVNIYGYLKEETKDNGSLFDNRSGSTVLAPFVVRDYKGGGLTVSCYNGRESYGCFPFNQYEVRNITARARYHYGSTLKGMADLYASDSHNTTTMTMLSSNSSDCFIQLSSNAYAEAKFTESSKYSDNPTGTGTCSLDIYGGCTFNSMSLTLKISKYGISVEKTVKSSDFYFPVSWRWKIGLYKLDSASSATYTASNKYSFLPGSSLTVGEGVKLTAGTLVFYEKWPSGTVTTKGQEKEILTPWKAYMHATNETSAYPYEPAYLVDNGSVEASTFAGLLKSEVAGATIKITSAYSATNYQVVGSGDKSTVSILAGEDNCAYAEIKNTATYSDGSTQISSTGTYTSTGSNGSYGFFKS